MICGCILQDDQKSVNEELHRAFPNEDLTTKIVNGKLLVVSIINSDLKNLKTAEKQMIADSIAILCNKIYGTGILDGVNTIFVEQRKFIVFNYSDATDIYKVVFNHAN
jgi:hypothetical protein